MEAWDIIVVGDGPAALRAAAAAAKHGASTLMVAVNALGSSTDAGRDGFAASVQESNNRSHREDTIRNGAFLCDQDIVAQRTADAVRNLDLLERWGVNFRRDSTGLPLVSKAMSHSKPRVADAGDATAREVQKTLEEQCMRYGVVRRGDHLPLSLIHSNQTAHGITVADMINGRILSIQSKAVIIADEGFEGVLSHGSIGIGMDLALQAGLPLRNMEFMHTTPLGITDTNLILPDGLLSAGATLHEASGADLDLGDETHASICAAVAQANQAVIDARHLGDNSDWWAGVFRMVKQRTGIDMSKQTVAIEVRPSLSIGGIATDEHGRAVNGAWSRWFTGLYAAGDAACSGFHGVSVMPGNQLLDAIGGGLAAGDHAGEWVKSRNLSGSNVAQEEEDRANADFSAMCGTQDDAVIRVGSVATKLRDASRQALLDARDAASLSHSIENLEALSVTAESIHLDQHSLIANTNLVEISRIQAGIRLVLAATQSALAREESRGSHQRSDYPEQIEDLLHHTTVDQTGATSTLGLRKGSTGNWVLPPQ
ncbi:MAG TPA: FAD-binding protein [Candidatus Poseidoniales archaeon]|nr:MAG TPA: FAD-binding protein [Candidatus Poseidoniales archaeon]HII86351.1 FAD-binding protein [Candidatus Poseidoniaceae archaeon]